MSKKRFLTNERLREQFDNSFHLVNVAIAVARDQIEKGEEMDSNPTQKILDIIVEKRLSDEKDREFEEEQEAV